MYVLKDPSSRTAWANADYGKSYASGYVICLEMSRKAQSVFGWGFTYHMARAAPQIMGRLLQPTNYIK